MPIDALLFDLGKVIVDYDFELGMSRFAANSALSRQEFERVILNKGWVERYETGAISTADYHEYLCDHGKLRMNLEQFLEAWSAVFLPDLIVPEQLLTSLKERYPLILVSNINESHASYIERQYSVFDHFDHRILSHEVGSLKPDRKIYEAAIAAAGKPPEALFFTDDREENVEMALRLGIRAHQFRSVPDLVSALEDYGVDTGDC